jgi:hypothetical protein
MQLLESVLNVTLPNVSRLDWRKEPDLEKLKTNPDYRVRAKLLRFLMLGGDDLVPVNESGVELEAAYIDGDIDLRGAICVKRLILIDCYINGAFMIEDASLGILVMQRSRVAGIRANRAKITGTAFLEGLVSENTLQFYQAELGGSLRCTGGHFADSNRQALVCSLAKIGGDVLLTDGFESHGGVYFNGAKIGGNLNCSGGTFDNGDAYAIAAEGVCGSTAASFSDEVA